MDDSVDAAPVVVCTTVRFSRAELATIEYTTIDDLGVSVAITDESTTISVRLGMSGVRSNELDGGICEIVDVT